MWWLTALPVPPSLIWSHCLYYEENKYDSFSDRKAYEKRIIHQSRPRKIWKNEKSSWFLHAVSFILTPFKNIRCFTFMKRMYLDIFMPSGVLHLRRRLRLRRRLDALRLRRRLGAHLCSTQLAVDEQRRRVPVTRDSSSTASTHWKMPNLAVVLDVFFISAAYILIGWILNTMFCIWIKTRRSKDAAIRKIQTSSRRAGHARGREGNRTVGSRAGQLPSVCCLAYVRARQLHACSRGAAAQRKMQCNREINCDAYSHAGGLRRCAALSN
jgi:hypothetical protein